MSKIYSKNIHLHLLQKKSAANDSKKSNSNTQLQNIFTLFKAAQNLVTLLFSLTYTYLSWLSVQYMYRMGHNSGFG